jgi:hypothetical protein
MPDQIVLKSLIRDSKVVHGPGGYAYLDCHMPVQIVFEKEIPLYYLYDTNGCVIEKIEVDEMPQKWRKIFEDDAA